MHFSRHLESVLAYIIPLLSYHRQVPQAQEPGHEKYISKVAQMVQLDNSLNIIDPIFGLLVPSAAFRGRGNVQDVECLQMAIADLAFTNAKKKHDLDGQVAALIYRVLERNTAQEGARSALCTTMQAVNPEIAALQQMQDPASTGATLHNQAVILELSRQISIVGGDPVEALDAVLDDTSDTPGVGHPCSTSGCTYSNNRSQFAISNDEIARYVVSCVTTTTIAITATVSSPWLPPTTTPVENSQPRLGSNSRYTNTDNSDSNSPHPSYTLPTLPPAPTSPTTILRTDINISPHNPTVQRAYSRLHSEAATLDGIPGPAARGLQTTIGEWGLRHSLQ